MLIFTATYLECDVDVLFASNIVGSLNMTSVFKTMRAPSKFELTYLQSPTLMFLPDTWHVVSETDYQYGKFGNVIQQPPMLMRNEKPSQTIIPKSILMKCLLCKNR